MIKFKIYESDKFNKYKLNKDEYLIFNIVGIDDIQFIKVISDNKVSKMPNIIYWTTKYQLDKDRIVSDIYYDTSLKYYFHCSGRNCNILWRGYNKDDAINYFNMTKLSNKYNI